MILTEKELAVCLQHALKPFLQQYEIVIKEARFIIDEKIHIQAAMTYQEHPLDLIASFELSYQDQCLSFQNISGKVEYLFLQLNVMSALQQFIHSPYLTFQSQNCYLHYPLPIQNIQTENHCIHIQFAE